MYCYLIDTIYGVYSYIAYHFTTKNVVEHHILSSAVNSSSLFARYCYFIFSFCVYSCEDASFSCASQFYDVYVFYRKA